MRALWVTLAFALAACATAGPAPELTGTAWLRADDADAAPHLPTITFTERGASGFAGCNQWFAAAERDGASIRFGNIGLTRRACPGAPMAAEQRFVRALRSARSFAVRDGELVLRDGGGGAVARFTPSPAETDD